MKNTERAPCWSREARAISARTPARSWLRKDISPSLSTICRRGMRGLPNGGRSKGATFSIGLLSIGSLRSTAQAHVCTLPRLPMWESRLSDPGKYYRNNVAGSLTLLEALRDHGVDQFVLSSTCATYGIPDEVPIDETSPQAPINPYGASKLMVERMLADFHVAHRLRSVALRYFNAAGADPDVEIGEDHDPETHLVPLVLDAACGDREAITIFGTDYETPDGTCVRDYIHVTDLAKAHVLALKALEQGLTHRAFNLGNGHGYSVREVIASVERVTGLPVPVRFGERRPGDPARLISNSTRAASELQWRPHSYQAR